MGPPPGGCIARTEVSWWGSDQMIKPPYHPENRRGVVTLIPDGAPILPPKTFEDRVKRALKLLETHQVDLSLEKGPFPPGGAAALTKRAKPPD
jgi:hypothetical protein